MLLTDKWQVVMDFIDKHRSAKGSFRDVQLSIIHRVTGILFGFQMTGSICTS
jgi:hypothetical protein